MLRMMRTGTRGCIFMLRMMRPGRELGVGFGIKYNVSFVSLVEYTLMYTVWCGVHSYVQSLL